VDVEVGEGVVLLHTSLREDENIRIVYRSIPIGTTMMMET